MIKKDVTYGDWRIVRHDDSKMEVYKNGELCPKSAPALRDVAKEVGLEVNPDWRTSQLGSNVVKAIEAKLATQETSVSSNDTSDEVKYFFPISDKLKEIVKNIKSRMKELGMNSFVVYANDYWGELEYGGDIDVEEYINDSANGAFGALDCYDGGDWSQLALVREIKLEDNELSFVVDDWFEGDDDQYSRGVRERDLEMLLDTYDMKKAEAVLGAIYRNAMFDDDYYKVVELNKLVQGL